MLKSNRPASTNILWYNPEKKEIKNTYLYVLAN